MRIAHIILLLLLVVTGFSAGPVKHDALGVSLIRLIGSPKEYAGKTVRVVGYLHLEFEGNGIYIHREDYERGLSKNSLWVDAPTEMMKEMQKLNDRYVLLEGVFEPEMQGHMGLSSGSIIKINRVDLWPFDRSLKK